jgi:hypothetical protein
MPYLLHGCFSGSFHSSFVALDAILKEPCFFPDLLLAGRLSRGLSLSHFLTPVAVAANQVTVAMAPIVMITLAMWNSKPWTRQVDKPCEDMEQTEQTFQFLQFLPAQVL